MHCLFIYLIDDLHATDEYFTYTTAVSIMLGGKRTVPEKTHHLRHILYILKPYMN